MDPSHKQSIRYHCIGAKGAAREWFKQMWADAMTEKYYVHAEWRALYEELFVIAREAH